MKEILKKAWEITRNNPILWLFGFFSLPLVYNELNVFSQIFIKFSKYLENFITSKNLNENIFLFEKLKDFLFDFSAPGIIISLSILIFIFVIAIFFEIQLIYQIKTILKKENENNKNKILKRPKFFWQIFILNLITIIIISILFLLFIPFISNLLTKLSSSFSNILFVLIFIILLCLILFTIWLIRFSVLNILFKKEKNIFLSLKSSLYFIYKNWSKIFYLLFLICIITVAVNLILFVILITSAVPLANLSVFFYHLKIFNLSRLFFILNLLFLIIITSFISGIFSAFQMSVWSIFYLEKEEKPVDK